MDDLKRDMTYKNNTLKTKIIIYKSDHTEAIIKNGGLEKGNELFSILIFAGLFRAKSAPTSDRLENGPV